MVDRQTAATKERLAWGNSGFARHMRMAFGFEDRPQMCFEALGDLRVERSGVQFSFLTPLPGDLNRFVMESENLDANRGRSSSFAVLNCVSLPLSRCCQLRRCRQ
jgi:hypothetical protein